MVENTDDVPLLVLPEEKQRTGSLSLGFSGISKFAIYTQKRKINAVGISEPCEEKVINNKVHIVERKCLLFDEEVRKLVNESNCTFLSSRTVPDSVYDVRSFYISLSHEHRSSIRQCIENMMVKENDIPEYKNWMELFDNIEIVWHLCELLHLDILVGDYVVGRLVEWVRFHCCGIELRASNHMLEDRPEVTCPDDYWDIATTLLLQARFEATRALLKHHSFSHTTPFVEANNILVSIPIFTVDCGLSVNEYLSRWKAWKSSVRAKISSGIFAQYPQLLEIMEIAGGDSSTLLKRIRKYCDTWYQLLSASLVFLDPTARLVDLPYYAELCIAEFGGQANMKLLDQTVHAIIESDLPKTISKLQMTADGGWSATHLANLLQLCDCFTSYDGMRNEVESLLVDYGTLLFTDPSLYIIGANYLEQCPSRGLSTLAVLLNSLPIDSEQKAYRLLEIANRNKLYFVGESICRSLGMKYMNEGHLNNALQWALESKDPEFMSQVADKFLHSYSVDKDFSNSCLLHLGNSTSSSERLTFAAKFAELNHLLCQNNMKDASDLLVSLLDLKVVPKFFYNRILHDALTLLKAEVPTLSTTQTLVILEALEDLPQSQGEDQQAKEKVLRSAIVRHLANSLVTDITPLNLHSDRVVHAVRNQL